MATAINPADWLPRLVGMLGLKINGVAASAQRAYLNIVAGTNITVTTADSATNDELTLTIASSGGGGSVSPVTASEKTANYTLTSADYLITFITNPNLVATLPAAPANGDTYKVSAQTTGCSVAGNGHNINGAATLSLAQYESVTLTYSSGSGIWVAT